MELSQSAADSADRSVSKLSSVVIPLLKGVLYQEENPGLWSQLLHLQTNVRDYMNVLGLELQVDEAEGYAFLRSRQDGEDADATGRPRLISRRQLSYPVSLLLALLRKKLAEFDATGGDTRLILSLEEVVDLVRIFLSVDGNEAKMVDKIDASLNKIADLGFIRRLRGQGQMIEVRRILKAFVDAQWLADFDERLVEYHRQYAQPLETSDD